MIFKRFNCLLEYLFFEYKEKKTILYNYLYKDKTEDLNNQIIEIKILLDNINNNINKLYQILENGIEK